MKFILTWLVSVSLYHLSGKYADKKKLFKRRVCGLSVSLSCWFNYVMLKHEQQCFIGI